MVDAADGYQAYYAGKLWSLLPQIYQLSDTTDAFNPSDPNPPNGPLRELVNRIGAQAATLRRSIDRMWEDQSIESCDDWVIPYIGAQVAANLVSSLDARSQRLAVFKTIYYRQRKGTLPILEQIAAETTGWDVRVVELYWRMGRARHGLDPAFKSPLDRSAGLIGANTGTPAGGYADLRDDYGASRARTAFDEFSYTADVRLGQGKTGWYNIPQLGIFLWPLQSVMVTGVTPVAATGGDNSYTFDPTGRDIQLFAFPADVSNSSWTARLEYQLPAPIDERLLKVALSKLYPNSIGLYQGTPGASTLAPLDQISADSRDTNRYVIDPVRGRISVTAGASLQSVSYCYGFSSTLGAGGYDRRVSGKTSTSVSPVLPTVTGGGGAIIAASSGTVEIGDSLTYNNAPNYTITGANSLVLRACNLQRPLVRFANPTQWTFTGSIVNGVGSNLLLDGLFVSGADIVLVGAFDQVTLSTCTLDPGAWDGIAPQLAIDGKPLVPAHLSINGTVRSLVIDRCILGPVATVGNSTVEHVTITNSILQVVSRTDAIAIASGETRIRGCTILGEASFRQLEASNSVFAGIINVADQQQGCLRFSAFTNGSTLPSKYRCVSLERNHNLFSSIRFGDPYYAQILPSVEPEIRAGAEDGSEMGAFSRDKNPIKERSLLIQYQEYMPIGLTPVLIYMT
jgi:hypothetical protein